jgi:hypothetical protein
MTVVVASTRKLRLKFIMRVPPLGDVKMLSENSAFLVSRWLTEGPLHEFDIQSRRNLIFKYG